MKKTMRFCSVILALTLCFGLLAGCGGDAQQEAVSPRFGLSLSADSLLLKVGESAKLEVKASEENGGELSPSFSSSRPAVASVDGSGQVMAVAKGNAVITVTVGEETLTCGVIVGLDGDMIDIRHAAPTPVVSEKYLLHVTVLNDLVVDEQGEIYYVMKNDSVPCDVTVHHFGQDGNVDEWMTFIGFGTAFSFSMDRGSDGRMYLWLGSNGNVASETQTISRIPWEPGKSYTNQGGQTWYFGQTAGAVYASVDQENGLVCVRTATNAGYAFTYYDYEDMVAGGTPTALHTVSLTQLTASLGKDINPDGLSVGEYGFHGFAVKGRYIYQFFGTAKAAMMLAVYDLEGNPQYVHKITEFGDMVFREADGLHIAGGKLYIGVTSGESGDRRGNVFRFD